MEPKPSKMEPKGAQGEPTWIQKEQNWQKWLQNAIEISMLEKGRFPVYHFDDLFGRKGRPGIDFGGHFGAIVYQTCDKQIDPEINTEKTYAEFIENIRNSMPKWSQNPSKIHQNSIKKSRSEKLWPKIDKN